MKYMISWSFQMGKGPLVVDGYTNERLKRIDLLRGMKLDLSDQQAGLNYEIFCPVVEYESIRYVVSVAAQMGMLLRQMDVTSAFLMES
uniref:Reverse transcriptase Ty1/copia-type domain-containing protein n=1 Tax=Amphimedon queenslandica TaxID=400682 RepID=A0A1X7SPM7_AMPQE